MRVSTIAQPWTQLGNELIALMEGSVFQQINFVSAFVGLRAVLRFKEKIRYQTDNHARVHFTVGIDLGGTSKDVLEEVLQWQATTSVVHNPIPRVTFHPKLYFFRSENYAVLYIGSNNWTDGGFYTNYELATKFEFFLPQDSIDLNNILQPLLCYLNPIGANSAPLTYELIDILAARGTIVNEQEARRRRNQNISYSLREEDLPPNPFSPIAPVMPPILNVTLRAAEQEIAPIFQAQLPAYVVHPTGVRPAGALVWQKTLSASEALQISNERTNPVGGIRLTQARFRTVTGRIDQTEYFRNLFSSYHWQPEIGRNRNSTQEVAIIPMRVFILNQDFGVISFEVSHKPDGEADQNNYTTIIRWGRSLTPVVHSLHLTGRVLSLYETTDPQVRFFIDIA